MNDVSSLLAQATATVPPVDKREEVAAAGLEKQLNFQAIATARATGKGSAGATGFEWDLKNLDPAALEFKYGQTGVNAMAAIAEGSSQNLADNRAMTNRNAGEAVWDTTTGVVAGAAGSLGGLGALAVSMFDDEAGAAVGQAVQDGMNWVEDKQSTGVNAARRQQRLRSGLDAEDNTAQYEQDVADEKLLPGLRRWGRDLVDTLDNSTDNGTMLVQGTSEAGGSLLAGGPVVKGLRALGGLSLTAAKVGGTGARMGPMTQAASRATRAGDWAAWPAGMAGLEAGGAYSGTVSEVMAMSFEDLERNSPSYRELVKTMTPEEARLQVADTAAKQAAAMQGAVGFASGGLSRWAETPFKVPSVRTGVANFAVKEPLEEAIQGTTGTLAQNLAVQQNADDTQVISEGVGEQTALGALYGFTSAAVAQGPATVAQPMVGLGQAVKAKFKDRYDAVMSDTEKKSPISDEVIQVASKEARSRTGQLTEALRNVIDASDGTPEQRGIEQAYVDSVGKVLDLTPEEVQGLTPAMQAVVGNATDRIDAIQNLRRHIAKIPKESPDRLEVIQAYGQLRAAFDDVQEPDLQILANIEQDAIRTDFENLRKIVRQVNNTPAAKRADATIDAAAATSVPVEQVSDAAITTPQGQAAAQQAATLMTLRPGTGSIEVAQQLLKHSNSGLVNLSPAQKRAVNSTLILLQAQERLIKARDVQKLRPQDVVNAQVISDSRDPLSGKAENPYKKPAREHVNGILSAVRSGNTAGAKFLLEDFGLFAQHMQNKLDAYNRHFKSGGANVSFKALSPDSDRVFYDSKPYVYVNKKNEASIRLAQTVAVEAGVVADIYNGLVAALPELNNKAIQVVSLDPALNGDSNEIVKKLNAPAAASTQQAAPAPAAEPEPTQAEVAPTPAAVVEAAPAKPAVEEKQEEPAVTNKQWFKSDRQDIRPDSGRARMKVGNTMITYDRKGDTINILNVNTPEEFRGGGSGRTALNKFLKLTDEAGVTTELTVAGYGQDTDQEKLRKFYNSLGFDGQGDKLTRAVGATAVKPAPAVSRITQDQVRELSDSGLEARIEKLDGLKKAGTATSEDLATLDVLDAEVTARLAIAEEEVLGENAPTHPDANPKMVARFPDMAYGNSAYSLLTAMRPTEQSRLADAEQSPADVVIEALSSQDALEEILGKESKHVLTNDLVKAYGKLLDEGSGKSQKNLGGLIRVMRDSLARFIKKNQAKFDKREDDKVNRWKNGKPLNIVTNDGVYEEGLLQSAALAALQWMLIARQKITPNTQEDYERLTGIADLAPDLQDRIDDGMTVEDVKFAIAAKVREYWGLRPNASVDKGYSDGISEGVAAELMAAMIEVGLLEVDSIKLTERDGLPPKEDGSPAFKTINRYKVPENAFDKILHSYPSAIDEVALLDPEAVRFIDGDMPPVSNTQMNNPSVENTKDQKRALKRASETPSRLNVPMFNIMTALGADGVATIFSKIKPNWTVFNKDHETSLKGRLTNIAGAFNEIQATGLEMANRAQKAGKPVQAMAIRFAYNMSKVGRMQMLGAYNAQSNKLMREVLMPTWSTLDLVDNTEHRDAFFLAIAQHLGEKVHKVAPSVSVAAAQKLLNTTYAPLVEYLREWMGDVDLNAMPGNDLMALDADKIMSLLGGKELNEAGFHSLVEYARYQNLDEAGRKSFETGLYLEADGVTNGPIMAMMMLTAGKFGPKWLSNVRKGGVHFGERKAMHELVGDDLYKTATLEMQEPLKMMTEQVESQKDKRFIKENIRALNVVMDALFGKDLDFNPVTGELKIDRGIAKNPLTITIYGSSAEGIAGSFANQILDLLAEQDTEIQSRQAEDASLSEADIVFNGDQVKWDTYTKALNTLGSSVLGYSRTKKKYYRMDATDESQYQLLQGNFLHGFVNPLVKGIEKTVGPSLIKSARMLRQATQVQSIFLEYAYQEEMQAALVEKAKDPLWQKIDFLSQDDLTAIDKRIATRFPNIKTESQVFRVAKTKRALDEKTTYSESLEDEHATGASAYVPTNAGVSGIASLVIGHGDGYMIQVAVQDPVMQGNLFVFDGINMPLDQLSQQGQAANRAAYMAFMQNPMKGVEAAYRSFLTQLGDANLGIDDEKMLKALSRAFQAEGMPAMDPQELAPLLPKMMTNLGTALAQVSKSIDARHAAMQDVAMSVDHMASANSPYTNGVQATQMTAEQTLALLNERYQFHLDNPAVPVEKPITFGERDAVSGAQQFPVSELLTSRIDLTADQQVIMQEVIDSLAAQDYVVVSGTRDEILKYRMYRGLPVDQIDENDNGFMSVSEKKVYLINADGETLTHELVHAATFETVLAYYKGNQSNPVINQAVTNLEAMMNEFIDGEIDFSLPVELTDAMMDARTAINGHLESDTANGKAAALNEFMAWSLSNQVLMDSLKTTPVPKLVQWAKDVIKAIKQMIWGSKKSPIKIGNDFLSNIQFNTTVLMHNPLTPSQMFNEVTLYHTTNARGDLVTLRKNFSDVIVSELKQTAPIDKELTAIRQAKYLTEIEEVAKRAATAFRLDDVETSTLTAIVAAMGTEMQFNSDVMSRMQTLYTHVQKSLEVESFIDENAADPQVEAHWAQEKFNLVMGKSDRKTDSYNRTTLLPMFVALSAVSGDFREVLSKITPPKAEKLAGTFDNRVRQIATDAMGTLSARLSGEKNVADVQLAMDALTLRLNATLQEEHSMLDKLEAGIDQRSMSWNAKIVEGLTALSDKGMTWGSQKRAVAKTKLEKTIAGVVLMTAGIASERNGDAVAEGVLKTMERLKGNNALLNFARDIIGRTEATADVYDLIKPIRAAVQQIRQQFRDSVPKVISDAFKKAPTEEQYATMFRSMGKTDLASLIGLVPKTDVLKLFSDESFLDQQIVDLESKLKKMDPKHFAVLQKKMRQLATYMNTGNPGSNLLRNAHSVARLWGESTAGNRQAVSTELETVVDQLTSLYAVEQLGPKDKKSMASLVQGEADGMNFALSYLEGQRKTEMAKTRRNKARGNYYKGYMHSLPSKAGHLIVADDSEFVSLQQRGYTRVRNYNGSSIFNVGQSRSYYYSDVPARAAFAQGMMQNVDQTAYGIDPATGFSHDLTAGRIVSKRLVAQLAASMSKERGTTENLLPVYNERGKVIAFEQSMDPLESARLEKSEQLHEMLGVWRGRQIEERFSMQQNKALVETLHADWEKNKNDNRDLYVNLFDSSTLDSVERDAVSLFSDEAKANIEEMFGQGVFMVRRAMLEDVTGYRNPSVSDFWTNINRMDDSTNKAIKQTLVATLGPSAYSKLVKAEQLIQGAVADIRTMVIVKSIVVPAVNMVSNIYQLISRGVSPIQVAKDTPSVVTQLHGYMESRLEQIRLEAKLRAVGSDAQMEARLRAKIRSISDSHKRLEIWPLIEAGEFSTVADVGMSRNDLELTSGRLDEWMGNQIDKLPPRLQTAARYALVTKETALFQGLQKSVQYGDFVAKAILYKHLTKKEGLTREQALARITEEFVNYDRLPGRGRGGLENMGLLWFYNFKLRTVKVGLSTIRNNPLHALLMMVLPAPTGVGTPIDENLIVKGMEGSLGFTVGPGIALRAPFMNPWYQLLN